MNKAKSRLKLTKSTVDLNSDKPVAHDFSNRPHQLSHQTPNQTKTLPPLLKKYLSHLPTLFLSLLFYYLMWLLMHHVYPSQIQNFIITNAYLPLALLFFLANFFLASFLLLSTKKGLIISLILVFALEFHLQKITF